MHNTNEAVEFAADDIARNGPFPRREAAAMREDDELYQGIAAHVADIQRWRRERAARQRLIRAGIAVAALTFVSLIVLGVFAVRSEECPAGAKSCKVLVLTPEEEQALMQPRGVLDTAREGRPLDLGQVVSYFRERISRAPAGTVPPEAVPVPRPRPPEEPQESKP